jgi:hypothetical protein
MSWQAQPSRHPQASTGSSSDKPWRGEGHQAPPRDASLACFNTDLRVDRGEEGCPVER